MKASFCILQALLMIVSSFSVYDSKFKRLVDRAALALTSETDFSFPSLSADEARVTDKEKEKAREFFNNGITGSSPAFDFTYGGKKFSDNLSEWEIKTAPSGAEKFRSAQETDIILENKSNGLSVTVRAALAEDSATAAWTVYIKNTGKENSPVIKNFSAADLLLGTGFSDVYFSKGSTPASDDFELMKSPVCPTAMNFNANGGRSESALPYFNISGKKSGAVVSVGWTGQWFASLRQTLRGVSFRAKQEFFNAYLEPGEEIRSPLVTVTFYDGGNPVKGFNMFRQFEKDCVYPESIRPLNGYVIANEFSKKTCDEFIEEVNSIDEKILEGTDYFWMDAGWYEYNEGWYDGVGNWIPDRKRFPDGMKPLADAMAAKGKKFLLWYEPERVREGTFLYNEGIKHEGWIIASGDNYLWNLGVDEACEFFTDYIASSLVSNGVTMYRQDFNFCPLSYWEKADKELNGGRRGIAENHYVTNLYRYLDGLLEAVDGLIIDNCASGGKRLDTEMSRRSIPLWRSDYNCGDENGNLKPDLLEATQSMTYGLSFWLPYTGTNRHFHSEYASRTVILTNQSVYEPPVGEYTAYNYISEYMTENYYPLKYGGTDLKKTLAMQFGSESEGAAIIYKREKVSDDEFRLVLSGLIPDAEYSYYDIDNPAAGGTAKGSALMSDGVTIRISDTPKAAIVNYTLKSN